MTHIFQAVGGLICRGVTFGPRDPRYWAPRRTYLPVQLSAGGPASGEEAMGLVGLEVGVQVYASVKVHLPTALGCCTQRGEEWVWRKREQGGSLERGAPHKSQALEAPS